MVRVVTGGRQTRNDLVAFNQHDAIQGLSELDRPRTSVDWVRVLLRVEPLEVARIGQRLVDLDRALRRFAAVREPRDVLVTFADSDVEFKGRKPYEALFPMSVDRAGLRLLDAAPGSLDLWLDAFGILGTIFASEPATATANALQILDTAGRLRGSGHAGAARRSLECQPRRRSRSHATSPGRSNNSTAKDPQTRSSASATTHDAQTSA